MYQGYFGLKDIPFSIAPNPDYLYMSERHKEALAHLSFGLHETGGFVLLTGEVGTGKTTVSRCLLEQIPDQTKVAFILNPTLTEHELLASICDEFNIEYNKENSTVKALTDAIKGYLLANHQAGQSALLIIDEAQHLRAEVLEQLRLLTNLETNTKKLLQVILIGQPELQALLKRQELRQLAQRITARYHLLPLSLEQVASYINHRLQVAGCNKALFTKKAVSRIHQISQGIPRIINLLCDRALMGAYVKQQDKVDVKIVEQAAREALDYEQKTKAKAAKFSAPWLLVGVVSIALAGYATYQFGLTENPVQPEQPVETETVADSMAPEKLAPKTDNIPSFNPATGDSDLSRAFARLANLWQLAEISWEQPCIQIDDYNLACYQFSGSFSQLTNLDAPALLELYQPNGNVFYALLTAGNEDYLLNFEQTQMPLNTDWLSQHWRGKALLIWQPPAEFSGVIDQSSEPAQIQWLDNQLSVLLSKPRKKTVNFDTQLQAKLNQFQNRHKLALTPFADTETVLLIQQLTQAATPNLGQG